MDDYTTTQSAGLGSASSICPPGYIDQVQAELPAGYKGQVTIEPGACARIIELLGTRDPTSVATKIFLGLSLDVQQNDTFEVDDEFVEKLKENSQFFNYHQAGGQSP